MELLNNRARVISSGLFHTVFWQYVLGRKIVVRNDHQALVWLFHLKEPSGKIARWIEILAPFDLTIEYRTGWKQGHCDALSRCHSPKDCNCSEVDMSEPLKCGPCSSCRCRAESMVYTPLAKSDSLGAAVTPPVITRSARGLTNDEPRTSRCAQASAGPPTHWLWLESPKDVLENNNRTLTLKF